MSELVTEGLRAAVDGREILEGVDLVVVSGEVHAVMGPNGSGKPTLSHVIAGRPGYEVLGGSVRIDDVELLELPAWRRAEAGLFLAMQYPTEVPGVALRDLLAESTRTASDRDEIESRMRAEAERIGFDQRFLERPLNVDPSSTSSTRGSMSTPCGWSVSEWRRPPRKTASVCSPSPTTAASSSSSGPTWCTSSPTAACRRPAAPGWRPSSRTPATNAGVGTDQPATVGGGARVGDPFADPLA